MDPWLTSQGTWVLTSTATHGPQLQPYLVEPGSNCNSMGRGHPNHKSEAPTATATTTPLRTYSCCLRQPIPSAYLRLGSLKMPSNMAHHWITPMFLSKRSSMAYYIISM